VGEVQTPVGWLQLTQESVALVSWTTHYKNLHELDREREEVLSIEVQTIVFMLDS